MRTRFFMLLALCVMLACKDQPVPAQRTGPTPAPDSSLAKLLGADDAGRGVYEIQEDGPFCVGKAPKIDRTSPLGSRKGTSYLTDYGADPFGFYAVSGALPVQSDTSVRFVLKGPAQIKPGPLALESVLENLSRAPIAIARAVDGSIEHWRWPFIETYVHEEGSASTYVWTHDAAFARCGNVVPREASDYPVIPAGGHLEAPFGPEAQGMTVSFARPGTYLLHAVYVACEGLPRHDARDDAPRPANLVTGPLVSNTIRVVVAL